MHKLRVTETARGIWTASIEGMEEVTASDRSPDQALASLIRANLGLFGVAEVIYSSRVPPATADPADHSHGQSVDPPRLPRADDAEQGG